MKCWQMVKGIQVSIQSAVIHCNSVDIKFSTIQLECLSEQQQNIVKMEQKEIVGHCWQKLNGILLTFSLQRCEIRRQIVNFLIIVSIQFLDYCFVFFVWDFGVDDWISKSQNWYTYLCWYYKERRDGINKIGSEGLDCNWRSCYLCTRNGHYWD